MNSRIFILPLLVCIASSASRSLAEDTSVTLRQEIAASPKSAPAAVARVLGEAGPKAASIAAPTVAAAIQALGGNATTRLISSIVYTGVQVVPVSVLPIVRAAVKAAPNAAPDIAASAVRALPNPWQPVQQAAFEKDAKDGENAPDGKRGDFNSSVIPAVAMRMTLAEAIAQTAFEAGSNASLADIMAAVDFALSGSPLVLFQLVANPLGVSGLGIFGDSNYENEPHLLAPKPPVPPTPVRPPVPPPVPPPVSP